MNSNLELLRVRAGLKENPIFFMGNAVINDLENKLLKRCIIDIIFVEYRSSNILECAKEHLTLKFYELRRYIGKFISQRGRAGAAPLYALILSLSTSHLCLVTITTT